MGEQVCPKHDPGHGARGARRRELKDRDGDIVRLDVYGIMARDAAVHDGIQPSLDHGPLLFN
jgi:hypothetical protein